MVTNRSNQVIDIVLPPKAAGSLMQPLVGQEVVRVQLTCPSCLRRNNYWTFSISEICEILEIAGQILVEFIRCKKDPSDRLFSQTNCGTFDVVNSLDEPYLVGTLLQIPAWDDMGMKIGMIDPNHDIEAGASVDSMLGDEKLTPRFYRNFHCTTSLSFMMSVSDKLDAYQNAGPQQSRKATAPNHLRVGFVLYHTPARVLPAGAICLKEWASLV
ncbi:hypothetical protein EGR_09339 [Echinococcus granulosus]|uniref:Uncharacterized protein n=1 Tax=Echinococcus granulosus TaxID=6210 RepID=W6U3Y7_ECHGR|nr:hypothetical protein EGR_09339 [Echinococcus granulosus]EUB55823.1 hypothetical protein EGR_09339 [Echinococcus granulosus]